MSMEKVKPMLKFDVPVHFEFASSELREADRPVLDRFASVVKEYYPGAIVTVEGFTDPAGQRGLQSAARPAACRGGEGVPRDRRGVHQRDHQGGELRRGPEPAGGAGGARARAMTAVENRRVALVIDHAAIATDKVAMP